MRAEEIADCSLAAASAAPVKRELDKAKSDEQQKQWHNSTPFSYVIRASKGTRSELARAKQTT